MTESQCYKIFPKEKALYEAVLTLMNDGVSISSLKVSDIAKEAGIGKGTTYEYVKSKEELIGRALFYGIHEVLGNLYAAVEKEDSFYNIFMTILDWIDVNLKEKKVLYQLISLDETECQFPKELRQFMKEKMHLAEYLKERVTRISCKAIEEGLIPAGTNVDLINMMLINSIISYGLYQSVPQLGVNIGCDEMRKFLYNSILRSFQNCQ